MDLRMEHCDNLREFPQLYSHSGTGAKVDTPAISSSAIKTLSKTRDNYMKSISQDHRSRLPSVKDISHWPNDGGLRYSLFD